MPTDRQRLERQRAAARAAYRVLHFAHRHGITADQAEEIMARAGDDEGHAEKLVERLQRRPSSAEED